MSEPVGLPGRSTNSVASASKLDDTLAIDRDGDSTSRERLLHGNNRRKKRRKDARVRQVKDFEILHEMEEGDSYSRALSSSDSGSDQEFLEKTPPHHVAKSRILKNTILHIVIAILFLVIALGAYHATVSTHPHGGSRSSQMSSNGTSFFAPTTILISLDGFRADYLNRGLSPTINALIQAGVSPDYMLPSFPSVTFPNHFTLATGLYPESHGIVGNSFYDPQFKDSFFYTDPSHSMQPRWWNGEPFWETAEDQGVVTAIHMWPGSEAHIGRLEPTYVDKFNGSESLDIKVDRILGLMDLAGPLDDNSDPNNPRPQLVAAYVPNVDANGHLYGPNSTEVDASISDVDKLLQGVLSGLEERNLTNIVNIVVVSDHGMASTHESRVLQLEDLVDTSKVEHFDGWPHFGLRPFDDADIMPLYESLVAKKNDHDGFDVYLRDQNMPERWHFTNNQRIAPLWIIPQTGWAIAPKAEFDTTDKNAVYHPKGIHGYDHEHPLMRAIFIARGPAFPHPPGSRVDPFQNTEVYNIICDSLGIAPRPNNGTLKLPLHPTGHREAEPQTTFDSGDSTSTSAVEDEVVSSAEAPSNPSMTDSTHGPSAEDQDENGSPAKTAKQWWEWITGKISDISTWAKDKIGLDQHDEKRAGTG